MKHSGYSQAERARIEAAATSAGWTAQILDSCASTQDVCRDRAKADGDSGGPPHLVLASSQTAGRGTHGRRWDQDVDTDLAMSVLVAPRARYPQIGLPMAFGAALHALVGKLAGVEAELDWPNDLTIGGRKAAGVLIEGTRDGRFVCGVGLNVNRTSFPEELRNQATSLALATGTPQDRAVWAAALIHRLADALGRLEDGRAREVYDAFAAGLGKLGQRVQVRTGAHTFAARLTGLDADGVRFELDPGEVLAIDRITE